MDALPSCWACRQRRVRCDLGQPSCSKCATKGIICPGYGATKPRRWKHYVTSSPPSDMKTSQTSSRYDQSSVLARAAPRYRQPPIACQKRGDDVVPAATVLDVLAYYVEKIAPDLTPDQTWTLDFQLGVEDWLEFDHPTRHLYICVVSLHQAIQRTPTITDDNQGSDLSNREMTMVHHHQACAARLLSEGVHAATANRPDHRLFRSIHMFLSSNVQQGAYTPWRSHLNGAHGLLALWGPKACLGEGDFVYFSLMVTNLFGTTTTPSHLIDYNIVSQHRFYLEIIDDLKIDFMGSLTPVPRTLVKAVAEINLLRATRGNSISTQHRMAEIMSFLNHLSLTGWAANTTPQHDALFQTSDTPIQGDTWSRSWEMLIDSFRQAIILYLVISMSDTHSDNTSYWDEVRITAYHALRHAIDRLFEAKLTGGTHHKFIIWPMVIAGVETVHLGDNEHLQSLQSRLLCVSRELGTLAMRDAAVFLAGLWDKSRRQGPDKHLSWDDILLRSPLFLM